MGITVRQALTIGGLQKANLLGGAQGLDRNIENISIGETPYVARWLKGDELMISAFYSIKQNVDEQIRILEAMHKANSSALVICYPEIFGDVSPLLIQKADEFAIPLLSVPEDVHYSDIITPVSRAISQVRIEHLEFINNLHNTFSDTLLQGKDLKHFASSLQQLTALPVMMLDYEMKPVLSIGLQTQVNFTDTPHLILERLKSTKHLACPARQQENACTANLFPIKINGHIEGAVCIITKENRLRERTRLAGEQAAIIYGWYILKDKSVKEALNRGNRDFLEMLLSDDEMSEEALINKADNVGLNTKSAYCVGIFSFTEQNLFKSTNMLSKIVNLIKNKAVYSYPNSLIVEMNDSIIVIFALPHPNPAEGAIRDLISTAENTYKEIRNFNLKCIIGLGRFYTTLSEIKKSYHEARTAIQIAKNLSAEADVVYIDKVEEYAVLLEIQKKAPSLLVKTYAELQKLIDHDSENGTSFFKTLQMLFITNQDINKAAELLFVHRNTVGYRKEKLKSILSVDPFAEENRFRFDLALRLKMLN